MKDMNQEQIEWTLIRKQIDGCLTDEERECLERWMAGDERRRVLWNMLVYIINGICRWLMRLEFQRLGSISKNIG